MPRIPKKGATTTKVRFLHFLILLFQAGNGSHTIAALAKGLQPQRVFQPLPPQGELTAESSLNLP